MGDRYTSFNDVTLSGSKCHSSPPLCIIESIVGSSIGDWVLHHGKGQAASSKGVRAEKAADSLEAIGGMLKDFLESKKLRSYC